MYEPVTVVREDRNVYRSEWSLASDSLRTSVGGRRPPPIGPATDGRQGSQFLRLSNSANAQWRTYRSRLVSSPVATRHDSTGGLRT